jgi:methionyl-tRNA formyltransferase
MKMTIFCTVSTGLDAIAAVLRSGCCVQNIVGVHPDSADPEVISGYVDIAEFSKKWNVPFIYVNRYDLKSKEDIELLSSLSTDLIWVAGWQRLIPNWLIELPKFGAIGGHGSPEGISGGRGRSPQNWAIMLGATRFDLALFKIKSGIDDGPIILERSFYYEGSDDILISYKKTALCMGAMVVDVIKNPEILDNEKPQKAKGFYYPQRKPEDGYVDWSLTREKIAAHCRALTKPYPGLRSKIKNGKDLTIWRCISFDDSLDGSVGMVSHVFEDGAVLVNCGDGRLLLTDFTLEDSQNTLSVGDRLETIPFKQTMQRIIDRHKLRYPELILSQAIINFHT